MHSNDKLYAKILANQKENTDRGESAYIMQFVWKNNL